MHYPTTPFLIRIPCTIQQLAELDYEISAGEEQQRPISFVVVATDIDEAHRLVQESLKRLTEPDPPPDSQA